MKCYICCFKIKGAYLLTSRFIQEYGKRNTMREETA